MSREADKRINIRATAENKEALALIKDKLAENSASSALKTLIEAAASKPADELLIFCGLLHPHEWPERIELVPLAQEIKRQNERIIELLMERK